MNDKAIRNNVEQSYALYQKLDQLRQKTGDQTINTLVSKIFIVKNTKGEFELVKKQSSKGAWIAFKNLFAKWTRKSGISKTQENVNECYKLATMISPTNAQDAAALETLCQQSGSVVEVLRKIQELANVLKQQASPGAVLYEWKITGHSRDSPQTRTTTHTTTAVALKCFNSAAELATAIIQPVRALINTLTDEEKEALVFFLSNSAEGPNILSVLQSETVADTEKKEALRLVLIHGLSVVHAGTRQHFMSILAKLDSTLPIPPETPGDDMLQQFAMVFGDSFIRGSGLEGECTPAIYSSLLQAFINSRSGQFPDATSMRTLLKNAIDIFQTPPSGSPTVKQRVRQALKTCSDTPKRCLLFGGWSGHAIVYEIEELPNGTYAFRVYNEGSGAEFHDQAYDPYALKAKGYIGITNISGGALFDTGFLESLVAIRHTARLGSKNIENVFVEDILPTLGGQKEPHDPRIDRLLLPQRSGTCCYRSILAWLAHTMDPASYKLFKFEWKMYLLDRYLPMLTAVAQKEITTPEQLMQVRQQESVIKRSLEKFTGSYDNLKMILPEAAFKQLQQKILLYNYQLERLDQQISAYEKALYSGKIDTLRATATGSPCQLCAYTPPPLTEPSTVESHLFTEKQTALLQAIESFDIRNLSDAEAIITQLAACATSDALDTEFLYICSAFIKKMKTLQAWQEVKFSDASTAFANLERIAHCIAVRFRPDTIGQKSEAYLMFLIMHYATEQAFRQLPPDQTLIPNTFTTMLSHAVERLETCCFHDPEWVFYVQQICDFQQKSRDLPIVTFEAKTSQAWHTCGNVSCDVPEEFAEHVHAWWFRDDNAQLRMDVEESIKTDRALQQKMKEEQHKRVAACIQEAEVQRARCNEMPARNQQEKNARNSAIESADATIIRLQAEKNGIDKSVDRDPSYWPQNFETDAAVRACFFLAPPKKFIELHPEWENDFLPQKFRQFFRDAILCNNICYRKGGIPESPSLVNCDGMIWYENKDWCFQCTNSGGKDIYSASINDQQLNCEYMKIFLHRIETPEFKQLPLEMPRRDLYSIRCNTAIQVDAVFRYLTDHPEALESTQWMTLLHAYFFESDLLLRELQSKDAAQLITQMQEFFNTSIANALATEAYSAAANLCWLAGNIQRYSHFVTPSGATRTLLLQPQQLINLVENALKDTKNGQYYALIFDVILASSGDLLNTAPKTPEEKKLFAYVCLASIAHNEYILSDKDNCLLRSADAEHTIMKLREFVSRHKMPLNDIAALWNQFGKAQLQKMFPRIQALPDFMAEPPDRLKTSDGGVIVLSQGRFEHKDSCLKDTYTQPLPDALRHEWGPLCDIYPSLDKRNKIVCYRQGSRVFAYDKDLAIKFIIDNDRYVSVQTHYGLLKYIPQEERRQKTKNIQLRQEYHWLYAAGRYYLYDKEFKECVYTGTTAANWTKVSGQGTELVLVQPNRDNPFQAFEDPSCTYYLADQEGTIQRIEFPRLAMTLEHKEVGIGETKEQRWVLSGQEEWFIAKEQYLPHFGQQTGFLIFENAKGEKRVILPCWEPKTDTHLLQSLNFPYTYDFQAEQVRTGTYLEYQLKENTLVPKTFAARTYLARIYMEKGYLDEAEMLLTEAQDKEVTSRRLSREEQGLLQSIITQHISRDIGSRTLRLQLCALYLLEKNREHFPSKATESESGANEDTITQAALPLLRQYLGRLGHIKPLPEYAETLLLKKHSDDPILAARLQQLNHAMPLRKKDMEPGNDLQSVERLQFNREINGSIGLKKPSRKDRMHYWLLRKSNKFPPDLQPEFQGSVYKYLPLLSAECTTAKKKGHSYQQLCKNKLIPMLLYIALCGQQESCAVQQVQVLLSDLMQQCQQPVLRRVGPIPIYQMPRSERSSIPRADQDLVALSVLDHSYAVQPEQAWFDTMRRYVSESTQAAVVLGENPLCHNNVWSQDSTVKNKMKEVGTEVQNVQNTTPIEYTLSDDDLIVIQTAIRQQHTQALVALQQEKEAIEVIVRTALIATPESFFKVTSGKQKLPTIEELCIVCARQEPAFIKQRFPELSDEGIQQLRTALTHYLLHKQHVQHLERSLTKCNEYIQATRDPSLSIDARKQLQQTLAKTLITQRAYQNDHPHALIFLTIETLLNITLRQEQVDNIEKFVTAVKNKEKIVLQMIMGGGKTSVIQTVLAFLFANTESLSTITLPKALFKPARDALMQSLGTSFDQCVFVLPYNRAVAKDTAYLEQYYENIVEAQKRGACILFKPRQKHAIVTSLYEAYYDLSKNPGNRDIINRINLIAKIYNFLNRYEVNQTDEIPIVTNPEVIFKFPVGERHPIEPDRAMLVSNMLMKLAEDSAFAQEVSIDFIDAYQARKNTGYVKRGAPLTADTFFAVVQPKLVKIAKDQLAEKISGFRTTLKETVGSKEDGLSVENFVDAFLTQTTPYDTRVRTLCTEQQEKEWLEEWHKLSYDELKKQCDTLSLEDPKRSVIQKLLYQMETIRVIEQYFFKDNDRQLLGSCAYALSHIFPHSFLKTCKSEYGEDLDVPTQYVARPYDAPGAQKPTVFSDPFEQVTYSMQLLLYQGIREERVRMILQRLHKEGSMEAAEHGYTIIETTAYQQLRGILEHDFPFNQEAMLTPEFVTEVCRCMEVNTQYVTDFFARYVVPQIFSHKESISSTPQTLNTHCGYTGTPETGTLPLGMTVTKEPNTDGKTIAAMEAKMRTGQANVRVLSEQKQSLSQQVIDMFAEDANLAVFIDSGGWLKEEKIDRYAEKLFTACRGKRAIEGVVYHNEKGEIVVLEMVDGRQVRVPIAQAKHKTEEGKYLTIIGQKYEAGTNILQQATAKAVMSVRKEMLLNDALQGIFRMRGILSGQSVSLLLSEEVRMDLATTIVDELCTQSEFFQLFHETADLTDKSLESVFVQLQCSAPLKQVLKQSFRELASIQQQFRDKKISFAQYRLTFVKHFDKNLDVNFDVVLQYFTVNQAHREQQKNWLSAQQKMREVIEKPMRMFLADPDVDSNTRTTFFETHKSFFVQTTYNDPYDIVTQGQRVTSKEQAKQQEIEKNMRIFNEACTGSPPINTQLNKYVRDLYGEQKLHDVLESCVDVENIAPVVCTTEAYQTQEAEQETEEEVQEETEVESQKQSQLETQTQVDQSQLVDHEYRPIVSQLSQFFQPTPPKGSPLRLVTTIMPKDVTLPNTDIMYYSENLFVGARPVLTMIEPGQHLCGSSYFRNYLLPGRYVLAVKNGSEVKYILISHQDAAKMKSLLQRNAEEFAADQDIALFSLDGKVVSSLRPDFEGSFPAAQRASIRVTGKICCGIDSFSRKEAEVIERFLKEGVSQDEEVKKRAKALRNMYEALLQQIPSEWEKYLRSPLDSMLHNIAPNELPECFQPLSGSDEAMKQHLEKLFPLQTPDVCIANIQLFHEWKYRHRSPLTKEMIQAIEQHLAELVRKLTSQPLKLVQGLIDGVNVTILDDIKKFLSDVNTKRNVGLNREFPSIKEALDELDKPTYDTMCSLFGKNDLKSLTERELDRYFRMPLEKTDNRKQYLTMASEIARVLEWYRPDKQSLRYLDYTDRWADGNYDIQTAKMLFRDYTV